MRTRTNSSACRAGSITTRNSSRTRSSGCSGRRGRWSAMSTTSRSRATITPSTSSTRRSSCIRGDDDVVRAFHNVCRHRASRLVDGPSGHCNVRLTCRYHAWSYDLRGKLAGIPFRDTFVGLDPAEHGLKPVAARDLSRLHLRAACRQRPVGRRDDGAVRARDRRLPHGRAGAARPRHAASARCQLEAHRRQLFRLAAHQCRASAA